MSPTNPRRPSVAAEQRNQVPHQDPSQSVQGKGGVVGDLHAPWLGVPLPGVAAIPLPRCATGVMLLLPPRMLPSQPPRCRPRCASCSHVHVGLLWVRLRLAIPRHWTATHAHSSVSTASSHQPTTTRARSCAMDDRARAKDGRPVTDCWSRGQRPHAGTR